jgi:hypothetical protein
MLPAVMVAVCSAVRHCAAVSALFALQGVMSVQNGRCVVTFNQNDQEVVKGVADYLRYAGEERIKKWRRHVRMVGECTAMRPDWQRAVAVAAAHS